MPGSHAGSTTLRFILPVTTAEDWMKSYADFMENDAWSCKLQRLGGVVFGLSKPRYSRFEPITPHRKNSSCEHKQGNSE